MNFVQAYDEHRYGPISKYNGHHGLFPVYRGERFPPKLTYGKRRAYQRPNITGSNSVTLKSPRPRHSVDTSQISSPESRTPTENNSRNSKFFHIDNQSDFGAPRNDRLRPSEVRANLFIADSY
jgi:hypothetical protein